MATYLFGGFELDTSLYQLRLDGEIVEIGPRVFDLLAYLIHNRDRLVSKDELIHQVWGATAMSGSSVPTCIAAVRKALGDDPANPAFIETHRGRGYRFVAESVHCAATAEASSGSTVSAPPAPARDVGRSIFVGRENELAALYAAFERTLARTPQLVLVVGEPGIGKTRTIEEFALTSRDDGAVVLLGRCIEGEGAPAFWPWVQIIRTYIDACDAASLPAALGPLASSLVQMIPDLGDRFPELPAPPSLDAEQARFRLFDAVTALLTRVASARPLVVLLDDLHRADTASLLLLQFATRELRDAPILFIGTYRDAELQADTVRSQILSDLAREQPTRCIHLHGLSLESIEHFVAQSSPSGVATESLVNALYDQTGGNPFFLTQIVHLLAAEGRLDQLDTDASWKIELPGGVRDAVARQLDGLPPETRHALAIAAVAGREFDHAVIACATATDPKTALAALEPALDAHLASAVPGQAGRYRFSHVLLRDCIYDDLPTLDRVQLHQAIGEALEDLHPGRIHPRTAELAYHFYEAIPSAGPDRAITYSIQAGEWAESRLAYEDVPDHYRRALRLLQQRTRYDPLEHGRLLLTLGEAEIRAGERERAQETFKEAVAIARQIGDPELLARAALGLAPGFFAIEVGVYDPVLVSLLEEALATLDRGDSPLRAQVMARLSTALVWSDAEDRRTSLSLDALQMAERIGDPETLAKALSARHESFWGPGEFQQREETIRKLGALIPQVSSPEIKLMHHLLQITASLDSGDVTAADQEISEYSRIAIETRQPRYLWYIDLFRGMRALMKGDFANAESNAYRFLQIGQKAKDSNAHQSFGAHLVILRLEQDRSEEILPAIESLIARYPSVNAWKVGRLFYLCDRTNVDAARHEFEHFARSGFPSCLQHNSIRIISLCLLAEVCSSLRDRNRAKVLYDMLLPERRRYAIIGFSTAFFGSVEERLGLLASTLGRYGDAADHFEQAIAEHERIGAKPWIARTQYHYATMLSNWKQPSNIEAALSLIQQGSKTSKRLGMANLSNKLARLRESIQTRS